MVKSSILEHLKDKTNLDENKLKALVFDYFHEFKHEEILKIMSSLQDFKVLDPACGSGAFPMGMLQEICSILEVLDPHAQAFITLQSPKFKEENKDKDPTYIRKLSILQNNIYGVDIQPMAIEISRLRCFLSLVCEEDKEHIAPLPNLEFKFVTANSLIPMPKNDNLLIHDAYATIKEVMEQYFISSDKEELQKKYKEAQKIIAKEYEFSPLADYNPFDLQSIAGFFDGELMFKTKEFDCVIGNPPYLIVSKHDPLHLFYKKYYKTAKNGKTNIYNLFFEQSLNITKNGGKISLITPNTYLASGDTSILRDLLLSQTTIIELLEYAEKEKIFEKVTQAVATIICIKRASDTNHSLKIKTHKHGSYQILQSTLTKKKLLIPISPLIEKMENLELRLKDFFKIHQGEINLTAKKDYFSTQYTEETLPMIRGDHIQKWINQSPQEWCSMKADPKKMFQSYRIVMQQVSNQSQSFRTKATLLQPNHICSNTTNYLIPLDSKTNLHLFLGIINSTSFNYYFNYFSFTNHLTVRELEGIPIPQITESNQSTADKIIALVEEILKAKEQNPKADTSAQESEIDKLVYALYNLTPEEIAIIEG